MSQPFLHDISCPTCLSPLLRRPATDSADCPACGASVTLTGRLCPACSTYHDSEEPICRQCATPLRRTCAFCQAINWSADSECRHCGAPLDTLATIGERQRRATDPYQANRRAQIHALREQEALAANQRMADLQAIEDERQARLRASRAQTRRREQRILRLGLIMAAAAIFILLLIALLSALT